MITDPINSEFLIPKSNENETGSIKKINTKSHFGPKVFLSIVLRHMNICLVSQMS